MPMSVPPHATAQQCQFHHQMHARERPDALQHAWQRTAPTANDVNCVHTNICQSMRKWRPQLLLLLPLPEVWNAAAGNAQHTIICVRATAGIAAPVAPATPPCCCAHAQRAQKHVNSAACVATTSQHVSRQMHGMSWAQTKRTLATRSHAMKHLL